MSLHGFNLLQDNTAPPDAWDMVYEWVNKVGRVIVIVVELIVILAFGIRVVVDTQTKTLIELEKQNSQRLAAFKQKELQFLDMQQRFNTYKQVWNVGSSYATVLTELNRVAPRNIEDLAISVKDNLITYKGLALTSNIGKYESSLKNSTSFKDVQVFEVEAVTQKKYATPQANFGIRIEVKPELIAARTKISTTTTK
jgi:Tfp pilus assembly protein PilN